MPSRLPIVAGLLSGVLAAVLMVLAIVVLVPDPAPTGPARTVLPSASPSPSPSTTPSQPGVSASPSAVSGNFLIGQVAPPLRVPQVGGGTVDLAALRGRPVWVNFMATWCPSCRDEFPIMNGFAVRYASTNLVVVAIDVREPETTADDFARSLSATFPVGLDSDGNAQVAWGALALPVHFWIDKGGIVRDGALGGIGPDIMAQGLQKILPGVTVTP
jgi:cytochrome c biogenesis protein CcmG, thiol:disulfide interchange protein DsbE